MRSIRGGSRWAAGARDTRSNMKVRSPSIAAPASSPWTTSPASADHPQRVPVVAEARAEVLMQAVVQHGLSDVPEGRMPEVVPERYGLGQVLVERERPGHGAGDPRRLERVREPGAVMVALGRDEDLRLVLQTPERLGVDDPVAIALERRPQRRVLLRYRPHRRVRTGRERRQPPLLQRFHALPEAGG